MENLIYGLRDPRNNVYCYIGKTTVGKSRPLSHLRNSHSSTVNDWVNEIRTNGFEPIVDVIEEVENINDLTNREKYWIRYYLDINPNLLNEVLYNGKYSINALSNDEKKSLEFAFTILPDLPNLLKNERKSRKINQKDMAKLSNISLGTLKNLERNNFHVGMDNYLKYLKVLVD